MKDQHFHTACADLRHADGNPGKKDICINSEAIKRLIRQVHFFFPISESKNRAMTKSERFEESIELQFCLCGLILN